MNPRTKGQKDAGEYWVGLDVSKRTFDAALTGGDGRMRKAMLADLPARVFARTRGGVKAFVEWLDARLAEVENEVDVRCVMEATGRYSTELAVWLMEARPTLAPAIAPPRQTSAFMKSLGVRNVTDKLAARCLAIYGMERCPEAYTPPSPVELELREACRYRDQLVRQRTAMNNQAGETTSNAFVCKNQKKRIGLLDADIERTEGEMRRLVAHAPELQHDIALIESIYGVGFLTAVVVRVELGDLRRFEKARQLSAFAGLNPSIRQSGTSVHGRTRLCKKGNARVRQALFLSAMVAIQGRNNFQHDYQKLLANGKPPMAALGAIMRKLLCVMRAVLISGNPYNPNWKSCGKHTHEHP